MSVQPFLSPFIAVINRTPFNRPMYRGADKSLCRAGKKQAGKSLSRAGKKQARNNVRDARDFNNIETRAVVKFFFSCKARRQRKLTPF